MNIVDMEPMQIPRLLGEVTPSFCVDDCIASYVNYMGGTYEYMYFDTLNIKIDLKKCKDLGVGKSIEDGSHIEENLARYAGLTRKMVAVEIDQALKIIQEELKEGRPVALNMEGTQCPWDWRYHTGIPGGHEFYLVGYHSKENRYDCVDPYYNKKGVLLTEEQLRAGYRSIVTNQYQQPEKIDALTVLKDRLNKLHANNYANLLYDLAEVVKDHFVLEKEVENYDPQEELTFDTIQNRLYLNQSFRMVIHNKARFATLLLRLSKEEPRYGALFQEKAKEVLVLSKKWDSLHLMMSKKIVARKQDGLADYLYKKIVSIASDEQEFIQGFIDELEHQTTNITENRPLQVENDEVLEAHYIDLKPFFNNEGIGIEDSKVADFNNNGEYFLAGTVPSGLLKEKKGISFQMADKVVSTPDNIACSKQNISVVCDSYKELLILGCSEWGRHCDHGQIQFEDGSSMKVLLDMEEWVPKMQYAMPENIYKTCQKVVVVGNGKVVDEEDCYLYYYRFAIDATKKVTNIILPECANMHIFAMTLIK